MKSSQIEEALSRAFCAEDLSKWFSSLMLAEKNGVLTVCFPHHYFADWFEDHVRSKFEQALADMHLRVVYECRTENSFHQERDSRLVQDERPFGQEFTFETFFANSKNHFPLASAREVAQNPGKRYNPLLICGESGAGKSHLLRAIANARSAKGADSIYLGSINDLHDLYTARSDARTFLQSKQFLAVDDLQDIVRHAYLESEMLALFDHFHFQRKQMVFACSGKVSACVFLNSKLKSRLESGLFVTLNAPDLDIRAQYAQARCRERNLDFSRDRILHLAQQFSDLRNLEGCLLKMWAYQELAHTAIADESFDALLRQLEGSSLRILTVDQIVNVVCDHFGVTREEIMSTGRKHSLVFARQVAMYLCREQLALSFPELGRAFGGRDHSTALYSCRKIEELQQDDKNVKSMLQTLTERCLAKDQAGGR